MRLFRLVLVIVAMFLAFGANQIWAQNFSKSNIPNFWDPNVRPAKPEGLKINRLRFLTTTDFPPFNFVDRNKRLSGFHIDLAREVCSELGILPLCQIQALPWNELIEAVEKGDGDAIIAGLQMTAQLKEKFDFSAAFLQIPARFTALRGSELAEPLAVSLYKKKTGLVKGSSHARYFKSVFSNRGYREYDTLAEAKRALLEKQVEALFSDAVSLTFWLTSKSAANCCMLVGGPYISPEYFGNGLTIAVAKGKPDLVEAINFALRRIADNGKYRELYLRYFPLSLY